MAANRRKKPGAARRNRSEDGGWRMEDGKGRRDLRGMIVRIIPNTRSPIPLTDIPLTLDLSRKITDRESSWNCVTLPDCSV